MQQTTNDPCTPVDYVVLRRDRLPRISGQAPPSALLISFDMLRRDRLPRISGQAPPSAFGRQYYDYSAAAAAAER